jgi:tetratricopeptide (TPR) repeat protein
MKDRDLGAVQDRLNALAERVSEIGDAQDRNDDAVVQLAGALSDLVGRMRRQDRGMSLNSFVAYALFTVLLGAAFFMLYRGRAEALVADRDRAVASLVAAENRAQAAIRQMAARDAAERAAAEIYELLRDHRFKEAIAAESRLADLQLTPAERGLITDAVAQARGKLAEVALEHGRAATARGEHDKAIAEARAALEVAPKSPHAAALHYLIGSALERQGKAAEAAAELDKAIAGGIDRDHPEARYLHATVLDKLARREDARNAYRTFAASAPRHPKAPWARRRALELSGPAPATKPAAPPAAPQP